MRSHYKAVLASIFLVVSCSTVLASDSTIAGQTLPVCPSVIPSHWLAVGDYPKLFCSKAELLKAQQTVKHTAWGKAFLDEQRSICEPFISMDEAKLRSLVPKPGSIFVYGLGMNLDPVRQKRMKWCGWDQPFSVTDSEGRIYPNDEWRDDGFGVADPKTGEKYYFIAQANAAITQKLEQKVLPALADVYALDGNKAAAKSAAILLDAISAVYHTNRRGPIDYPLDYPEDPTEADRAGRLDRPYYQTARGLMNYANTIDLIASSGEFEKLSTIGDGLTIREHIIRNLLWDGSSYCMDYALKGYQLHNGHSDYLRGAAVTGILLDSPDFCYPLFHGVSGMSAILDNNIDRSGLYYETSPMYAEHTRELFISMAEIFEAARKLGWKNVESIYANPAMNLFFTETFDKQEVGGHIPVLGDDGPDAFVNDPMRRLPVGAYTFSDNYIKGQILGAWLRLVKSPDKKNRESAARLLADTFNDNSKVVPPSDRWSIYHIGLDAIKQVEKQKPDPAHFETDSAFYGAKGLALLRGGRGSQRYGAQLFFGPLHLHGQAEALTWSFYDKGAEWSFDPGYFNSHYRFGWTGQTVSHQAVIVDASSINPDYGTGHLISWLSTPEVQWAMANHPGAYKEQGVTTYERLIAQVNNSATGELGYWLDVSRVAGGKMHDDSFHTQMQDVKLSVSTPEPSKGSLFGPIDYGRLIQDDYHLKGYTDKWFYWSPDGDGYGFLGSPRTIPMESTIRATLTRPGFAKNILASVVVDFDSSEGRQFILADSPQAINAPCVPYIIRRDKGNGLSVFAKIIRVVDNPEADYISSFTQVPIDNAPETKAWCVTFKDGSRDLWIVGDGEHIARLADASFPEIHTDARIALIRFDSNGKAYAIKASEASNITVNNGPILSSVSAICGIVERVNPDESPVVLRVSWDKEAAKSIKKGDLLITTPSNGQPSSWEMDSVKNKDIMLVDIKSVMATTDFMSIENKPGWYKMLTGVSRFYSASGKSNKAFAIGKSVYTGGKYIGRVSDIADDVKSVKLELDGQPVLIKQRFRGKILEVGPGDKFRIPLSLSMTIISEGLKSK